MATEAGEVWERLGRYFTGVVTKRLSKVEADPQSSNQHEFNGTVSLKALLGTEDRKFEARLVRVTDDRDTLSRNLPLTWYESRKPPRSEHRLYFPASDISEGFREGDLLAIGKRPDHTLVVINAPAGSTAERHLLWLFGTGEAETAFKYKEIKADEHRLRLAIDLLLDEIGIEIEPDSSSESDADRFLRAFGKNLPTSKKVSEFARSCVKSPDAMSDPDAALVAWLTHEESIFKHVERREVESRLKSGFSDVEDFLGYSLSIHNRRKSRAGRALENHLEEVLLLHQIKFTRGGRTEGKSRPDFLFPGESEYRDPAFPDLALFMMGAKTTCKDRWRQVLAEAQRIKRKHLMTLEPGISEMQTDEMEAKGLQLIVPAQLKASYSHKQSTWLQTLSEFIDLMKKAQAS